MPTGPIVLHAPRLARRCREIDRDQTNRTNFPPPSPTINVDANKWPAGRPLAWHNLQQSKSHEGNVYLTKGEFDWATRDGRSRKRMKARRCASGRAEYERRPVCWAGRAGAEID